MLLHLIDRLEENSKFIDFMKDNGFLTDKAYSNITKKLEEKKRAEKNICNHLVDIDDDERLLPKSLVCEECKKDNVKWVELRLCLTCGHVGCCDSSEGKHATKHFVNTGHPTIVSLPDRPWKWCYIHKLYV